MKKNVLVIGDLILDLRRYGTSVRTSPEDPRCRVLDLEGAVHELGGAANVARWLAACPDLEVQFLTQIGADAPGRIAHMLCNEAGVRLLPMLCCETTVKERICLLSDQGSIIEQIVRVDRDSEDTLRERDLDFCFRMLNGDTWDAIVIADYGKGVFDGPFGTQLRQRIGAVAGCITLVNAKDPIRWEHLWLKYLICNDKEALKAWGALSDHKIVQKSLAGYFVRTRGENGVTMTGRDGHMFAQSSLATRVVDVTGAGDAFTAGFASYLIQEGHFTRDQQQKALARGSLWAAHCCRQIGCGSPPDPSSWKGEDTMGTTHGWKQIAKLCYNGQPVYVNEHNGDLAFENLNAEGRLMALPAHTEAIIKAQL